MNKIILDVPKNIKFISSWEGYEIPYGRCIIDKGVTGCGFTEFCLTNHDDIILCSPRKLLLESKIRAHKGDKNIFYLQNPGNKPSIEDLVDIFDDNQGKPSKQSGISSAPISPSERTSLLERVRNTVDFHIKMCRENEKPVKFLVTYDSIGFLIEALGERVRDFKTIVDEFQSIFLDSTFKPDVELGFVENLAQCPNVVYLSATPYLESHLDKLEEFRDLDMYVFEWTGSPFVEKANILKYQTYSSYKRIKAEVKKYLKGIYPVYSGADRKLIESREMVVYFNSVKDICNLIKSCGLTPENTDIICSVSERNLKKLKKHGFSISAPNGLEDIDKNKMFTFCTRAVYVGVDFYSKCATTWVVSNPNVAHLSVDIAMDLPQIVGRQRLEENPWKNVCYFLYQTNNWVKEDYDKVLERKIKKSKVYLSLIEEMERQGKTEEAEVLVEKAKKLCQYKFYEDDYIGFSKKTNRLVFNNLVMISELRFWEVTQQDYLDSINVGRSISSWRMAADPVSPAVQGDGCLPDITFNESEREFCKQFEDFMNGKGNFETKMVKYCEYRDQYPELMERIILVNRNYETYYNFFGGTEGIRRVSSSFKELPLRNYLEDLKRRGSLRELIYQTFSLYESYSLTEIKEKLGEVYDSLDISRAPKATDLLEYFEVKTVKITSPTLKTRTNGYKILGFRR